MGQNAPQGLNQVTELLSLLRSKNRCLERFLAITQEFWEQAGQGDLNDLEAFQGRREETLNAISLFDRKIDEISALIRPGSQPASLVKEVKALIDDREKLIHRILELDLKVIGVIEDERSRLLSGISAARRGKDSIAKFKSTWIAEHGEEIDQTL